MKLLNKVRALRKLRRSQVVHGQPSTKLDLYDFVPAITPRWQRPDHLAPIVELFQRIDRGEEVYACVSVPPQHGKTETLLHAIAWLLGRHPEWPLAYTSYAADFAKSKSRLARDYALRAGVQLRADSKSLSEWRTPDGGGLLATGVGGPLTGHGVRVGIVDDPHKNRAEAESRVYRDKTKEWFTSTLLSRIHPGGSVVVVHTRWHEDDLIGWLSNESEVPWEVINLPALNELSGEVLWDKRPLSFLQKKRKLIGEYDWASLYQGSPRPKGGSVFGDVWFYDDLPTIGYRTGLGTDLAYSEKTQSDYSVAIVLFEHGDFIYVVEVVRRQVQAPEFSDILKSLADRYPGCDIWFYCAGIEKGAASFFIRDDVPLSLKPATSDKFVRAQPVAAAWNSGKVLVPRDAPWVQDFVRELKSFTGIKDKRDDQVDALAAAYDSLALNNISFGDYEGAARRI